MVATIFCLTDQWLEQPPNGTSDFRQTEIQQNRVLIYQTNVLLKTISTPNVETWSYTFIKNPSVSNLGKKHIKPRIQVCLSKINFIYTLSSIILISKQAFLLWAKVFHRRCPCPLILIIKTVECLFSKKKKKNTLELMAKVTCYIQWSVLNSKLETDLYPYLMAKYFRHWKL